SDPSSIVEGTLTSSSFNLQGADDPNTLEGEYYTNEEGNRVFVSKQGTMFIQDKDNPGQWACAGELCGESQGRNFRAEVAETGIATTEGGIVYNC
ncbi:hypothetical protein KY345_03615, partial [Candidatus Woesearchaeota archaeon]|nr:hypothetical protein [Candidatus Woesearchaeota archaeon]